jgi:hypothetical protein
VIVGLCDTPERIPARIFSAVRWLVDKSARLPDPPADCPCCAFWRGVALGVLLGACSSLPVAIAVL